MDRNAQLQNAVVSAQALGDNRRSNVMARFAEGVLKTSGYSSEKISPWVIILSGGVREFPH
jgi:hypothetical protein